MVTKLSDTLAYRTENALVEPAIRSVALCLLALLISACATPYQPDSRMNLVVGGYSDYRLDENTFSVSFRGGNQTPQHLVEQSLLFRCAEVAVQNGFGHFAITRSGSDTRTGTATLPAQVVSNSHATAVGAGNVVYATGASSAYLLPPQYIQWREYTATVTIDAFPGPLPAGADGYDASEVVRYLGPQIRGNTK